MIEEQASIKLVRLARQGHEDCMNRLAEEAEGRLRAYIYRVTLDHDLTQDLSQEALLQMVKSLKDLKKAERFWPWLYRIAQSKIQQHFKAKQRKTRVSESAFYKDFLAHRGSDHQDDSLGRLVQKELSRKVMTAMQQMRQQYRAVLSLRCLEQLSYADIGVAMQCSEVTARVLFFRARQALKKQLNQQGLSKGLLLTSLGLFGKLTAPAEAASSTVTVTATSTKVGLITALIGTASTKLGIATLTAATIGLIVAIGMLLLSEPDLPSSALPPRAAVRSLYFTAQLLDAGPGAGGSLSKGAYEQWFYFPGGIDGPMFMRMQRWDTQQEEKLCSWLQDAHANYYYNSTDNEVRLINRRVCWSNLRVRQLPTDTAEFLDFLLQVEGDLEDSSEHSRDPNTGLLTSLVDYRFANAPEFRTDYRYNTVGPERFQYDWAVDVPVVDQRDQMRKRGWTYFRVHGRMGEQAIAGRGRVPFVYEACEEHPAWMTLSIGNELEIVDCSAGAQVRRADGTVIASYPPGSFFKGLARPWMGMHTMNLARRDAIAQQVWFKTRPASNKSDVLITFLHEKDGKKTDLVYTIDTENDIIKDIRFDVQKRTRGSLVFSFIQDIDRTSDGYSEPAVVHDSQIIPRQSPGMLWLVSLAQGNMGK